MDAYREEAEAILDDFESDGYFASVIPIGEPTAILRMLHEADRVQNIPALA